jgi:hypothetical protein
MKVPNLFANVSKLNCFPAIIIQGYAYGLDLTKTMGFQIYNHGCVIIRRTLKFAIVVRGMAISLVVV